MDKDERIAELKAELKYRNSVLCSNCMAEPSNEQCQGCIYKDEPIPLPTDTPKDEE